MRKILGGNKLLYYIILLCFWAYVLITFSPLDQSKGTNVEIEYGEGKRGVLDEITKDTTVQQTFYSEKNNLNKISLYTANFQRVNNGLIHIVIKDNSNKIIEETDINMNSVPDNNYLDIPFETQPQSKGKDYSIEITSEDATQGNAITVYKSKIREDCYPVIINNIEQNKMLSFKLSYKDFRLHYLKICCWIIIILLSFVVVRFAGAADEKTFVMIMCFLGLSVLLINPFFHPIDESTHFFRSFMISEGNWLDSIIDGKIGGWVPDNYEQIVDHKLSIKSYFSDPEQWNQKFSSNTEFYYNPYMSSVTPINHAIAAIGIFVGYLLQLPAIIVILLGRICDWAFYTGFCYLAIKKADYYKNLFFIVATLPMGIWLAGSYSIDPILISSSLLFTSICLKHYFNKEIVMQRHEKLLLLLCGLFIASVKYLVYTPILLLFFLIPKEKFSKKEYVFEWIMAILIVIGMVILQLYLLNKFPFTEDRNGDVDVARQVQFMIQNKKYTLQNFSNYFTSSILTHIESFNYFGLVKCITPLIGLFAVFGSAIETKKYNFEVKQKRVFSLLCLFIFVMVFGLSIVSLYVGFTPVGKFAVEGLQTRYLLPVIIFLMLPVSGMQIENKIKNYDRHISIIMIIGILDMIACLLCNIFA